jgi:hypothetical protein
MVKLWSLIFILGSETWPHNLVNHHFPTDGVPENGAVPMRSTCRSRCDSIGRAVSGRSGRSRAKARASGGLAFVPKAEESTADVLGHKGTPYTKCLLQMLRRDSKRSAVSEPWPFLVGTGFQMFQETQRLAGPDTSKVSSRRWMRLDP